MASTCVDANCRPDVIAPNVRERSTVFGFPGLQLPSNNRPPSPTCSVVPENLDASRLRALSLGTMRGDVSSCMPNIRNRVSHFILWHRAVPHGVVSLRYTSVQVFPPFVVWHKRSPRCRCTVPLATRNRSGFPVLRRVAKVASISAGAGCEEMNRRIVQIQLQFEPGVQETGMCAVASAHTSVGRRGRRPPLRHTDRRNPASIYKDRRPPHVPWCPRI